jgi:phage tail sheath protein FI
VAELVVSGTDTVKLIRPQAQIARAQAAVTAFVGRALKGPVNRPVTIGSFDDYQRIFGGLWQPSTLSYAVEQYFDSGGGECVVVRVCNGGRAPTLRLPAGATALLLIGVAPGTREFLRASVDYDGIPADQTDRFNLVLQRIRAPGSELIEEQEIFRRLSIAPAADRNVADALAHSKVARVLGELPPVRPARSIATVPTAAVGYAHSLGDGDDGDALTDYDIIGDASSGTGLFALRGAEPFNFLCIPPLTRTQDVGLSTWLVALRMCREHQAMLLLDPPSAWTDVVAAIDGVRGWPFFSEDALMFYPRIQAFDRLRGRDEVFGSAPTAAGLIAQATRACPVWSAAADAELALRSGARAAVSVSDMDRVLLARGGVNVLQSSRLAPHARPGLRTLLPERSARNEWRYVSARRLALFLMRSVEAGTRWAVFEQPGPALWKRVREQVLEFFDTLDDEGAFVGGRPEENYFVICDQRLDQARAGGGLQLLFGFAVSRPGEFHTCLVDHWPTGSSVRPVSVNRYALPLP